MSLATYMYYNTSKYSYLLPVFFYLNFEFRININIINNENKTYNN